MIPVYLHQQLQEVIAKRDEWRSKEDETPEQERERLLQQVKQDNQEISSLEKKFVDDTVPMHHTFKVTTTVPDNCG